MSSLKLFYVLKKGCDLIRQDNGYLVMYGSDPFALTNCYMMKMNTSCGNENICSKVSSYSSKCIKQMNEKISCGNRETKYINCVGTRNGNIIYNDDLYDIHSAYTSFCEITCYNKLITGSWDSSICVFDIEKKKNYV